MICKAAHLHVLKAVPRHDCPIDRNANTPRGYGFHEKLPNKASRQRYYDRKRGKVPALEYLPLSQAVGVLL